MKLCPKCQKQFSDDANFCPVDAARLTPLESQAAQTDSLAAKYDLGEKLGGSRTGSVHRAVDKSTRTAVAIKLVSPSVVALPGVAQRLERELKQLERVQSAGVTKVLGSGKRGDGETWIALELLDGAQTLAEAITARGPLALDHAAHLIEVVGEALIEAAQVGVVHRDLAPKNIMFAGADVKLINFSLPVPTTEKVPGVPEFVAPEQVDGKPVDQRSNLYSLGALYYYVLTGQTVHGGSPEEVHRAHTNGSIKTPSSLIAVPGPVEAVIMRALDRSPTKRFLTVRQFVDEVSRIARGEVDVKTTQPLGKSGGKPKAELVQTLLGVRSGGGSVPAPAPIAPAAPVVPPAAVTAPGPAVAAPMTPPVKPSPLVVTTVAGVPTAVAPSLVSNAGITPPPAAATASASPNPSTTVVGQPAAPAPAAVPQAIVPPERSPWAPPSTVPPVNATPEPAATAAPVSAPPVVAPTPISQAPTAASPAVVAAPEVPAAPVVAAPVLKAPTVAPAKDTAGASGKNPAPSGKKKAPGEGESKGKFRETMWFKKGELDAEAAQAAAQERARTGKDAGSDKADSLPIDERYKDDGSITRGDKEKYSLRTGATQMMSSMKDDAARSKSGSRSGHISEDELINEMKGGRNKVFIMIGAAVVALIVIIILMVM